MFHVKQFVFFYYIFRFVNNIIVPRETCLSLQDINNVPRETIGGH